MINNLQEISIESKLRSLYDLQIIDSRIDEVKILIKNLPLEIRELDNEVTDIKIKISKLEEEINTFQNKISEKKDLINNSNIHIEKYESQKDKVRNNRELDSIYKEIEYQKLEIDLGKKRIKEFNLIINKKKDLLKEFQFICNEKKENFLQKKKKVNQMLKNYQKEIKDLLEKLNFYSKNIENNLLQLYKRIRSKSKNGLAITLVDRGASSGSFFTIPPQKCIDISQRKKIVIDEHSGRILIDSVLAEEERQKIFPKTEK